MISVYSGVFNPFRHHAYLPQPEPYVQLQRGAPALSARSAGSSAARSQRSSKASRAAIQSCCASSPKCQLTRAPQLGKVSSMAKPSSRAQRLILAVDRGGDSVASHPVGDLLDQVRSLAGGVEQVRAAGFDEHALRARADQRPLVLDQESASRYERRGHLHDAGRTRATVLQNLFHAKQSAISC